MNAIRLHMGTAHMACDPGRGGHHDQKGGIGNIVKEAPEGGGLTQEELETLSGILAKMFRSMSARGRQDPFLGEEEIFAEE